MRAVDQLDDLLQPLQPREVLARGTLAAGLPRKGETFTPASMLVRQGTY